MSALVLHLLFAFQALFRRPRTLTLRERSIAAQHEAAYRSLASTQLYCVWCPAARGDA